MRMGALSGRGEILIQGAVQGHVRYSIDECHNGGLDGRCGRIAGDDALLRVMCDRATDVQLRCNSALFEIHMSSYILGRGSAEVSVGCSRPANAALSAVA